MNCLVGNKIPAFSLVIATAKINLVAILELQHKKISQARNKVKWEKEGVGQGS